LKLTTILAQYLYTNKRLELPGIGKFLLDSAVSIEDDHNRHRKEALLEGVSFESNKSTPESPELIQYISAQSGKIKALASADLASHLGLALQFINIGKPFLFEGIGSLSKSQSGELVYSPGLILSEKSTNQPTKETDENYIYEEPATDYKSVFYNRKVKFGWAKPIAVFLVIAGMGLAIWGGYTVYKRTSAEENNFTRVDNPQNEIVVQDTPVTQPIDSLVQTEPPAAKVQLPAGMMKFVIETADSIRATARYNQLKTFLWDVNIEQIDSSSYKLYMILPASAMDSSRVKDSLTKLNGRTVSIEQ